MLKKLIWLVLVAAQISFSQSKISGKITGSNKEVIPYATVHVKGTTLGAVANEKGYYELKNLSVGDYVITASYVGYKSLTKSITILDNEIKELSFQLVEDTTLDEVEVFGNRFEHPDKIEALTRLPLAPYEQIQSISIISDKLIEQQGNLTIADATKNVPGVYTFATYGNKRESMSSRGFRGIPILKNGVRVHSDFRGVGVLTDMQGVDNIQVLKGSATITQGVATDLGSPGGVINIVTKTPRYVSGGNVSLRAGSFGQARTTFDVYGPLVKTNNVAFRLNGALERSDSYRNRVSSDRFYINPSLEWKPDDKTTLTFEMDYFEDSRTPDLGTVNLGENDVNNIYDLPHDKFLGFSDDKSLTSSASYSIRFNRELNDKLSLRGAYYKSNLDLDDKGASLGGVVEDEFGDPVYNQRKRGYSASTRSDDNSVLQFDLIGEDINTGSISHTFQVGFDYRTTDYSTWSQRVSTVDTIDVFTGNTHTLPDDLAFSNATTAGAKSKAIGFVAQDVITFNKYLKTFLGVRFSKTQTIAATETTESDAVNPRWQVLLLHHFKTLMFLRLIPIVLTQEQLRV